MENLGVYANTGQMQNQRWLWELLYYPQWEAKTPVRFELTVHWKSKNSKKQQRGRGGLRSATKPCPQTETSVKGQ